jgi:hypothetical protein
LADEDGAVLSAVETPGMTKTIKRIRVKHVRASKLSVSAALQGWTSMETYHGDGILQEFDLFNEEDYEMSMSAANITGGAMSSTSPARLDSVGSGGPMDGMDRLGDGPGSGGSVDGTDGPGEGPGSSSGDET